MTHMISDWPYNNEGMDYQYRNNSGIWTECLKDHYEDQFGCLPPIRMKQGVFMVGEPFTTDSKGTLYATFVQIKFHNSNKYRYFGKFCHIKDFDPAIFKIQIIDQVLGK